MNIILSIIILTHVILNVISISNALIGCEVEDAEMNELDFVVSFININIKTNKREKKHFCTGTLISRSHVLTAAHCIENDDFYNVIVLIGSKNLREASKYRIKSWITYNEWAYEEDVELKQQSNDIGIIILKKCVSNTINPVIISNRLDEDLIGKDALTAGWGYTETGKQSKILKKVRMHLISHKACTREVRKTRTQRDIYLPDNLLCSHNEPYALLECGDSGGPLLLDGKEIIGVNESTCPNVEEIEKEKVVNLFTSIAYYREFIDSILSELLDNNCCIIC